MKSNNLKKYAAAAVLLASLCAVKADDALNASKTAEIKAALSGVSLMDAVNSSVALVAGANPVDRSAVTVTVLDTVAHTHAAALPKVVAAILRRSPDMAVDAASEAARLHPEEVVSITRYAVQAAPSQAGAIVESVLFFAPDRYQDVGEVAIDAAPSQTHQILHAVSINSLEVRSYIEDALAANSAESAGAAKALLRHASLISKGVMKYRSDLAGAQVARNTSLYGGYADATLKPLTVSSQSAQSGSNPSLLPPPVVVTSGSSVYSGSGGTATVVISTTDTSTEQPGGHTYDAP